MMNTLEIYQKAMVTLITERNVNYKLYNRGRELGVDDLANLYDKDIKEIDEKIEWLKAEIERLEEEM